LKLQPDFGETSTERSLEVVLFLLLCQVLDSKEVLHLDMEEGMRLVLLEACILLLLVLACKGVGAPPQVIRICHLLLEHGAVRVAAVGVMVGDHHTTQDQEDMVAGCGSVPSMTVEVPIPSLLFPLGLGSPVYETA
jgi:hypothetical protein